MMYRYSLRLQLSPMLDYEDRIAQALDFCKRAKIDDVIFFVAAEDLCVGHIEKTDAKKYTDVINRAKKDFETLGITVSLNPWLTLGHYDGGRRLKDGQNFTTMVGHNGIQADMCVCPLDKNWRNYYTDLLRFYADELPIDTLWLEDDFRLTNKQTPRGMITFACFCDEHMRRYSEALGERVEREEFALRLATDLRARKAYIDVARETMEETLQVIVDGVPKQKKFGLMTGGVSLNQGRRFGKFFEILSKDGRGKPYNRQTLCAYRQIPPQTYSYNVHTTSMLVRALTGDTAECVSEIVNFPHGNYVKSVKFDKIQMISSLPLLFSGATFSVFDFTGNGAIQAERLGDVYGKIKPYLSAVAELGLLQSDGCGVRVLVDENVAYKAKVYGGYAETYQDNTGYLFACLATLGIACVYTSDASLKGEVIAVCGDVLRSLGKETVERLFQDNFVILSGDGVEALFELGLNGLIGATDFKRFTERDDPYVMEQLNGDEKVCGVTKLRATNHFATGDYYRLTYAGKKTAYASMLDCYENPIGDGITRAENALIIPFAVCGWIPYSMFTFLREYAVKKAIAESGFGDGYYFVDEPNVSPYVFEKDGTMYWMIVNYSEDDYEKLHLKTNRKFTEWKLLTVENPQGITPRYQEEDGGYVLEEPLNGWDSCLIILK
ncbi:MAG: hypothetical protein IJB97_08585 [Clostridia bacterium]|nr:hypothetical protein [Clostridia bacterium]